MARREDVWTCRDARAAVGESDRKTGRQEMTSGNGVEVENIREEHVKPYYVSKKNKKNKGPRNEIR